MEIQAGYGNHSLESKDIFADMKELYKIMEETEQFILV